MSTSEETSRFRNFGGQQHVIAVDEAFDKVEFGGLFRHPTCKAIEFVQLLQSGVLRIRKMRKISEI